MAQRDRKKIVAALGQKGFVESRSHHRMFWLHVGGRRTSISTKISHGSQYKVYGDVLLSQMSKALKLRKADLLRLIDCHLKAQPYVKMLLDEGYVRLE